MRVVLQGDCLTLMRSMPPNSVDSVVTDPPYGLSFMGKKWDYDVPSVEVWAEVLRVLKPGGHLLAFAGTRTQHRMACRIEDAGFEIRDMIAWAYGSGFPKSLDVSKALDKSAGAVREVVGQRTTGRGSGKGATSVIGDGNRDIPTPATEAAKQWDGWGTALKPALEPVTMARKPLDGTVAANVMTHGCGALNIDGCRVATDDVLSFSAAACGFGGGGGRAGQRVGSHDAGRWPANLIHDGSAEALAAFPDSNGSGPARTLKRGQRNDGWGMADKPGELRDGGSGSASRFFYCAKASKADRGEGNKHPTVKPHDLMRYLCRLVTPPGGTVLDPFTGSGSTGKAAAAEGFNFIGCELDPHYVEIARRRLVQ